LRGLSADDERPQAHQHTHCFGMIEVPFGQHSAQNTYQNRVNQVENLMRFGPVVLDDLLIKCVGLSVCFVWKILSKRIFNNGRESIHCVEYKIIINWNRNSH
jgi:hypothetical protein